METNRLLKDLNDEQGSKFIKVRILREWEGRKQGSQLATTKTYIIVDEEGTQVQAGPLKFELMAEFTKKLQLGGVYQISKYNVLRAPDTYRPVPGKYIVNFDRKTIVTKLEDDPAIPRFKFVLKTYQEARARLGDIVTLIDVVGKLIEYTHIKTANTGKKSMDIILADERDDTLKVTLWENQAYDFLKWETEYKKPNVIVIVTGTTTKSVKREIVLWSSSSTQYFFNIEHTAVITLRQNSNLKANITPTIVPFIKDPMQAMIENVETVTIEQLFDAQLPDGAKTIEFYTEATVVGLIPQFGWYYIACSKCNKKMKQLQQCDTCTAGTKPIPRYKVTLAVHDSTSDTSFVLFDRNVMKLINVSAQHILDSDQNASLEMIPPILNNILGRVYIFKLRLNDYNTVMHQEGYTVMEVEEVDRKKSTPVIAEIEDPDEQPGHATKEPSDSHPENKRKLLNEEQISDHGLPATDKLDKSLIVANAMGDPKNVALIPPTPSGMKEKAGSKNPKRQK